jgi:hypothetical protein
MGLACLEPLLAHGPWVALVALLLILGIQAAAKLIGLRWACKGADPKDRPGIIKAVAELFRWRR